MKYMHKDPCLQRIEQEENKNATPEEQKLLVLFLVWLQLRKHVKLSDYPREYVKEFLALEKEEGTL